MLHCIIFGSHALVALYATVVPLLTAIPLLDRHSTPFPAAALAPPRTAFSACFHSNFTLHSQRILHVHSGCQLVYLPISSHLIHCVPK
ncbi:hypothetical protein F5B18DRAFT_385094 [Nemania serpens]|nr:hypothetical protein F5B18DRAFT_385094 [Nemania serpens]